MEDSEIRENFAKNLLKLRKNKKWNQQEMADKLSYSDKAISKWENGDTIPDIYTMKRIADLFGISVDQLISNENVVRISNKKKNRALITLVSSGLCYLIATIVFFALKLNNIDKAYLSYLFATASASIVCIVFIRLWYKKVFVMIAIDTLVISIAFIIMIFMNFYLAWVIILVASITIILLDILIEIVK